MYGGRHAGLPHVAASGHEVPSAGGEEDCSYGAHHEDSPQCWGAQGEETA